jgi:hypothetical protein
MSLTDEILTGSELCFTLFDEAPDGLMNFMHVDSTLPEIWNPLHFQFSDVLDIKVTTRYNNNRYMFVLRICLEFADEVEAAESVEGKIHDDCRWFFFLNPVNEIIFQRENDSLKSLILHHVLHQFGETGTIFND